MKNELSKEILATETHEKAISYYQASEQFGYKFLMELKKIRDEKLFIALGFENFDDYSREIFNYSSDSINERIKSAIAFGNEYNGALRLYGKQKTHQLAQLPELQRNEAIEKGIPTKEGNKPISEATTREIDNFKRQIKEKDELLSKKDDQIATQARMIDDLNEQEPQVVEKEVAVEKIPDDYDKIKDDLESAERSLKIHRSHIKQLEMEREQLEKQLKDESDSKKRDEKQDELQEMELKRLQREADINVYRFILATNNFIKDQSISAYDSGAIASASEATKEKLIGSVQMLEKFIKEIKTEIKGEVTWVIN